MIPGKHQILQWKEAAEDLLFPPVCSVCNCSYAGVEKGICTRCFEDVTYITSPLCSVCGRPFAGVKKGDHLCETCLRKPPAYTLARGIVVYQDPVKQLLHRLKYRFDTTTVRPLLKIAQGADLSLFDECDVFVPVPLHVERLRQRGMNQALVLARLLLPQKKTEIRTDILVRDRSTASQTRLDINGRKKNLKDAFSVQYTENIKNNSVCLVDDVYTTGATATECARQLLRAGAREVRVLTLARVKEHTW